MCLLKSGSLFRCKLRMLYDDVLRGVGDFGRYQWLMVVCCALATLSDSLGVYGYVFVTIVTDRWCKVRAIERVPWRPAGATNLESYHTVKSLQLIWRSDSRTPVLQISYVQWLDIYSISQEICTRLCCALLCCGYTIVNNEFTWSIYPYSSGLLCWHWGNR